MEIKEIKEQLSILTVLQHYGLQPNKNKMLCCPFHDDKNPSMQVYAETNTVFCFSGNCKMNGKKIDTIQFIQDKENLSKHEAIKKAESLVSNGTQPVIKNPIIQAENLTEIFSKLKPILYSSSKARAYAESRNIYNAKLEAGYNNGTHYRHLKNCMVFPLKDKSGNIVSLYGRNIESKGKDDRHFYTANRKGLYPNYPIAETETIIITESIIDSATLQLYTTYTSLALYGTNVLNDEHKEALQSLPKLQEIIFFLNGDEAGREWTTKHADTIIKELPTRLAYRYGFNGMEKDDEIKGAGNSYDFGARIYDPRVGRWLSVDPKAGKYPMDSPYSAFGNNPIIYVDPNGEEKIIVVGSENRNWNLTFILPGMKAARELKKLAGDEQTTLLLFKAGYSDGQLKRIQKYMNKKGVMVQTLTSADDLVNYLNNKSITTHDKGRSGDKVSHLEIYSHGTVSDAGTGALNFGYHQENGIEEKYRFDKNEVSKVKSASFEKDAFVISYACRTGAGKDVGLYGSDTDPEKSLAQNMADQWGVTIYALQRRSEYGNILPEGTRGALTEYFFPDKTYEKDGGTWDTDAAIDKVKYPTKGTTPSQSPAWTEYKKGKSPKVLK